jgi:hypothetical protein
MKGCLNNNIPNCFQSVCTGAAVTMMPGPVKYTAIRIDIRMNKRSKMPDSEARLSKFFTGAPALASPARIDYTIFTPTITDSHAFFVFCILVPVQTFR